MSQRQAVQRLHWPGNPVEDVWKVSRTLWEVFGVFPWKLHYLDEGCCLLPWIRKNNPIKYIKALALCFWWQQILIKKNTDALWSPQYAELETILGDIDRAQAVFELAIGQPKLDMPEVLWKAYIDFEIEQEEFDRTRKLYRRLLERTHHVKVSQHLNSAQMVVKATKFKQPHSLPWFLFILGVDQLCSVWAVGGQWRKYQSGQGSLQRSSPITYRLRGERRETHAAGILERVWGRAHRHWFGAFLRVLKVKVLETDLQWNDGVVCLFSQHEYGDEESKAAVAKLMPTKVKKRRKVQTEDGVSVSCCFFWSTPELFALWWPLTASSGHPLICA